MRRSNLDDLPPLSGLPAGYALRLYRDEDLWPLADLLRAAFDDDGWTPEQVRAVLIEEPSVKTTFVIEHHGEPIATASARLMPERYPGSGYLHWVAAAPSHHGQGLGRIVSLAVLHEFVRLGCRGGVLETQDYRLAAIATYQKLGFNPDFHEESHATRWAEVEAKLAPR
ncbi:MAG: GNAT family N-acetyltransferase [Armatimonadota bacterium]|nr:GNAT family N-acetyltransferase [Armatimonadota bacterium]